MRHVSATSAPATVIHTAVAASIPPASGETLSTLDYFEAIGCTEAANCGGIAALLRTLHATLGSLLRLGNALNAGTHRAGAAGFRIDTALQSACAVRCVGGGSARAKRSHRLI